MTLKGAFLSLKFNLIVAESWGLASAGLIPILIYWLLKTKKWKAQRNFLNIFIKNAKKNVDRGVYIPKKLGRKIDVVCRISATRTRGACASIFPRK